VGMLVSQRIGRALRSGARSVRAAALAPAATASRLPLPAFTKRAPALLGSQHVRFFAAPSGAKVNPDGSIDFLLADIGEGIAEVEVMEWFVKAGDTIAQFDKVCSVQSDKATVEITSRFDGVVKELKYQVKDMAQVGSPLITLMPAGGAVQAAPAAAAAPSASPATASATSNSCPLSSSSSFEASNAKVLASPAVRHMARQHNINLALIAPTGPKGRVIKEDILNYMQNGPSASAAAAPVSAASSSASPAASSRAPAAPAQPAYSLEDQVVSITGLQRVMVQTMNASNAVPTLGYSDEINMDELVKVRKQLKNFAEEQGVKLSFLPFIIKAVSLALRKYPSLNAHVNSDCTAVTVKGSHNIGLAMDSPRGLLVPNIKNVQDKSILEIARELNRLAKLGAEGKLGREDLAGGTFTLSNIGSIGGTYTRPLLVVPEVVIGGLGKFQTVPRFDAHGQVKPSTLMVLSWSADHRVVDGATIARFSNAAKNYLEHPSAIIMDTR